jgi:hypothetical protein
MEPAEIVRAGSPSLMLADFLGVIHPGGDRPSTGADFRE